MRVVFIHVVEDSWAGPSGVLLIGAIGGVAEGCRRSVELSLAFVQLGEWQGLDGPADGDEDAWTAYVRNFGGSGQNKRSRPRRGEKC